MKQMLERLALAAVATLAATPAFAQNAMEAAAPAALDVAAKLAELEKAATAAQSAADNAWILTSSALVLMMTAPGLMLFYGGLVRAKNVLSLFMQCFYLMGMISLLWLVYGYSLAFAPGNPFIGGFDHLFLKGVGMEATALTIPDQTFAFFQLMFAIITPALIVGAFAERFRFKALAVFMIAWVTVVYVPLAHMVWGPGGFLHIADGTFKGLDFAGGTVVHISSGVSALVCAIYLGKRNGYPSGQFVPHNLIFSATGAAMLWVGWFGFNAGSALGAGGAASGAFLATHMSAAAATISWLAAEWLFRGKPSLLGGISGAVAGLVAVTPAAGFVTPVAGTIIGLLAGVVCWLAVTKVKAAFGYDDSLDVFGVHGVGGMLGAVLTGVFAHSSVFAAFGEKEDGTPMPVGLLEGNPGQVFNQIVGIGVAAGLAVVGTLVILFVVDKLIGVRATAEEQETGLDIVDHGEQAYHHA